MSNMDVVNATITELYPDEKWRYLEKTNDFDTSYFKFENSEFKPDASKINKLYDEKLIEYVANEKATKYQKDRNKVYPHLAKQLDLLYHDMAADKGTKAGEWFKAIKKVKDDNPKS